jgi:hypothetical protein
VRGADAVRVAALALAFSLAGCAGARLDPPPTPPPSPAPTSCGGNVIWPPPYYPEPTGEISAELSAPGVVRVTNHGRQAWTVRVAPWILASCVGWIALGNTEGNQFALPSGSIAERTVAFDPGWEERRIGIELWDHPCDDRCTDPLDAFNWLVP